MSEVTIDPKSTIVSGVWIQQKYDSGIKSARNSSWSLTRNYQLRKKGDSPFNKTQEMEQGEAYKAFQSFIIRYQQILVLQTNEGEMKFWAEELDVKVDQEGYPVYQGTAVWKFDPKRPHFLLQPVTWSHRMTGGTRTVKYPARPQRFYTRPGEMPIPHFGVNWDGAKAQYEGVDIYAPEWTVIGRQQILKSTVTTPYLIWLNSMAKTTNALPFNGLSAGTVLYLGADIEEAKSGENDVCNLTHQFALEPNMTNFFIEGILVPFKGGHEYLWTEIATMAQYAAIRPVPQLMQVNVAPMYDESDLNLLFA